MTVSGLSSGPSEWDRARRAYRALVGEHDPALGGSVDPGDPEVLDVRPGGPIPATSGYPRLVVASGPDDLIELRRIVEQATGVGTWPAVEAGEGELRTAHLEVVHPAPLLALLMAMEGLIDDRSPWSTWRSVVDTLAVRVGALPSLTVQARIHRI